LGDGAYFFEDDWMRALFFAQQAAAHPDLSKGKVKQPAVVGAVLRVHRWLDLCTSEGRADYRAAYDDLVASGTTLKKNKASPAQLGPDDILRLLDRQIINHIHVMRKVSERPAYDAVRSYFPQGNCLADSSAFQLDTHIQIALRDENCVLGYFRVREAEVPVA
jgi:hypothetical protein